MLTLNPKPASDDSDGKLKPPTGVEKTIAMLTHLSGIFWIPYLPMPVLALIIPFLVLQFARVHSEFVEQHAVQVANFQLLMGCFYALAMILSYTLHNVFPIWWVAIGSALFCLWEGAKAVNGWPSRYPLNLKLFK